MLARVANRRPATPSEATPCTQRERWKAAGGWLGMIERLRSNHYDYRNSIRECKILVVQDNPIPDGTDDRGRRKVSIANFQRVLTGCLLGAGVASGEEEARSASQDQFPCSLQVELAHQAGHDWFVTDHYIGRSHAAPSTQQRRGARRKRDVCVYSLCSMLG